MALGLAIAGLLAVFSGGLVPITAGSAASAPSGADEQCAPSEPWTEVVQHPAVSHTETVVVVDQGAWTETIPGVAELWQNFAPDKEQGTFEGPPAWPDDPRGKWLHIEKPIPPGHAGPDGVYQQGQGNGSWFYRRAAVPEQVIEHPAVTHQEQVEVIDEPAWTGTIEHPAVVCPGPTESTTEPTTEPTPTTPPTVQPPEVLEEQEAAEPASEVEAEVEVEVPTVVDAGLSAR